MMSGSGASQRVELENVFVPSNIDRNVVTFSGPHFGGPAVLSRVFGGNTATQVCNAVRSLCSPMVVLTVKVNFLAPAIASIPTDYAITFYSSSNVANVIGYQKGKLFVTGKATFGNPPDFLHLPLHRMPKFNSPLQYPTLKYCMATCADPAPWNVFKTLAAADWFDVRPIDFGRITTELRSNRSMNFWAALAPHYRTPQSLERADGVSVVMLLSDYLIGCPGLVNRALIGSHRQFDGGASLSHVVTFHTPLIDSSGWFLFETISEVQSTNRYLLNARIFAESGELVATVVQEAYSPSSKL